MIIDCTENSHYSNFVEVLLPLLAPVVSSSVEKIGAGKQRATDTVLAVQAVKAEQIKAEQKKEQTKTIIGVVVIIAVVVIAGFLIFKKK